MTDGIAEAVEKMVERGIGFKAGDIVVIESKFPVSQGTAEVLASYFGELHNVTGARFVLLDYGLKVSEVHRK